MTKEEDKKDKSVDIIVNGEPKTVPDKKVTYEEAIELAFPELVGQEGVEFTVSYRKADDQDRPAGTLRPGKHVNVKDGTIFDVTSTTRS